MLEGEPAGLFKTATTRQLVIELIGQGLCEAEIARRLGRSKSTIAWHFRRLDRPPDERFNRRYDWAAVQAFYDTGRSVGEACAHFGFSRYSWHQAVKRGAVVPRPQAMSMEALLSDRRSRNHLKLRLFAAGLKENRCEECGIDEWRGRPLNAALHHRNGIKDDNRLENLCLLCPNCHSQTENFSGRNVKRRAA